MISADTVLDRNRAVEFASEARKKQRIELDSSGTTATLLVGPGEWPLPMPIVEDKGTWRFDAEAGAHETLLRRIGRNELDAIEVCRGFVEAQREYARTRHEGARVNQYAQRVISTPGKRDGLTWQAADGSWEGPVGEAIARAIAEGYTERPTPYHGYYYKVLKGQGPAAPLGEMRLRGEGHDDRRLRPGRRAGGVPGDRREDLHREPRRHRLRAGPRARDARSASAQWSVTTRTRPGLQSPAN